MVSLTLSDFSQTQLQFFKTPLSNGGKNTNWRFILTFIMNRCKLDHVNVHKIYFSCFPYPNVTPSKCNSSLCGSCNSTGDSLYNVWDMKSICFNKYCTWTKLFVSSLSENNCYVWVYADGYTWYCNVYHTSFGIRMIAETFLDRFSCRSID